MHGLIKSRMFDRLEFDKLYLECIANAMDDFYFSPDDKIVIEGSEVEMVYFILEGHVSVSKGTRLVAKLGHGDVFGGLLKLI